MELNKAIEILTDVRKHVQRDWEEVAEASAEVLNRLELMEPLAAKDHYLQAEMLIEESRDASLTDGEEERHAKLAEAQVHAILALGHPRRQDEDAADLDENLRKFHNWLEKQK